jgi:predicted dehydrogenase
MAGNDPTSASDGPLGVAILGFWHVHADGYAQEAAEHPGTRLVAAWDPDPQRGREGAARLGVPYEPELAAVLARDDVDGVTVTTATSEHPEVIGAALGAGVHVFTEKLLAGTEQEAADLLERAAAQGAALVVSLPRLAEPTTLAAARLLDEGALGRLTYARFRMAHDGWIGGWLPERFGDPATAIGGALADLGCHPVYLVQRFLGAEPERVDASYARVTGRGVEDNAVVTMRYPDGAIGVAEASFVTTPGAATFELRGTEGSLLSGFGSETLLGKGPRLGGDAWTAVALPEPGEAPFALWVRAMRGAAAAEVEANQRAALELTRVVVRANTAAL